MAAVNYPESWGADESRLWEDVSDNRFGEFGSLMDDRTAVALFNEGWISDEPSPDERGAIRDAFFDYCIEEGYLDDPAEFDWEAWREYMGY